MRLKSNLNLIRLISLIIFLTSVLIILEKQGKTQATVPFGILTQSESLSNCPKPKVGYNGICSVTDGFYITINGGNYTKLLVP